MTSSEWLIKPFETWAALSTEFSLVSKSEANSFCKLLPNLREADDSAVFETIVEHPLVKVISLRHGSKTLISNLYRYWLKAEIQTFKVGIASFSISLLERSKLVFNRELAIYEAGAFLRNELYSKVLVDAAETFERLLVNIELASANLSVFVAHQLAFNDGPEKELDEALAKALGFLRVDDQNFWRLEQEQALAALWQSLDGVVELSANLASCVQRDAEKLEPLLADCQWNRAFIASLKTQKEPMYQSLYGFEKWRQSLDQNLEFYRQNLENLFEKILGWVGREEKSTIKNPQILAQRLQYTLVQDQIPFDTAKKASADLLDYLARNQLEPTELIQSELSKIHPALVASSSTGLLLAKKAKTLTGCEKDKRQVLAKTQDLLKSLSQFMPLMLVFFCFFFSCAVKSEVKSKELSARPLVPLRLVLNQEDIWLSPLRPSKMKKLKLKSLSDFSPEFEPVMLGGRPW